MAKILVVWELGGGLGHVSRVRSVVDSLADRGHRVVVALRDVSHATSVFRNPEVWIAQSPFLTPM